MHIALIAAFFLLVLAAACLLRGWYVLWLGKTSILSDPEWLIWIGAGMTFGTVDLLIWLTLLGYWLLSLTKGIGP